MYEQLLQRDHQGACGAQILLDPVKPQHPLEAATRQPQTGCTAGLVPGQSSSARRWWRSS